MKVGAPPVWRSGRGTMLVERQELGGSLRMKETNHVTGMQYVRIVASCIVHPAVLLVYCGPTTRDANYGGIAASVRRPEYPPPACAPTGHTVRDALRMEQRALGLRERKHARDSARTALACYERCRGSRRRRLRGPCAVVAGMPIRRPRRNLASAWWLLLMAEPVRRRVAPNVAWHLLGVAQRCCCCLVLLVHHCLQVPSWRTPRYASGGCSAPVELRSRRSRGQWQCHACNANGPPPGSVISRWAGTAPTKVRVRVLIPSY